MCLTTYISIYPIRTTLFDSQIEEFSRRHISKCSAYVSLIIFLLLLDHDHANDAGISCDGKKNVLPLGIIKFNLILSIENDWFSRSIWLGKKWYQNTTSPAENKSDHQTKERNIQVIINFYLPSSRALFSFFRVSFFHFFFGQVTSGPVSSSNKLLTGSRATGDGEWNYLIKFEVCWTEASFFMFFCLKSHTSQVCRWYDEIEWNLWFSDS